MIHPRPSDDPVRRTGASLAATLVLVLAACRLSEAAAAVPSHRPRSTDAVRGHLRTLHAFSGGADGALPAAGLLLDRSGTLFGTTQAGGAKHFGTAFALTPSGASYSVLYSFKGRPSDGAFPTAALIEDAAG